MSHHLGSQLSALVDGRLSVAATERALAHVAGCGQCADELAAARIARSALAAAATDEVPQAPDLAARLLSLGCELGLGAHGPTAEPDDDRAGGAGSPPGARPGPLPGVISGLTGGWGSGFGSGLGSVRGVGRGAGLGAGASLGGGTARRPTRGPHGVVGGSAPRVRDPFAEPALGVPEVHGRQARALRGDVERRHGTRVAMGSLAGLGAVAAMLFALGDRPAVVPTAHPAADLDLLGHAASEALRTTGADGYGFAEVSLRVGPDGPDAAAGGSGQDVVASLRDRGWSFPAEVPEGWSVAAVRWDDDARVLEVDLTGPQGALVVTEQEGRLETTALTAADRVDIGGRDAYVVSYTPWHVVWQCGSTVVQVVAPDDVSPFVEAFPVGTPDDGVPARISRGWSAVAAAFDRS